MEIQLELCNAKRHELLRMVKAHSLLKMDKNDDQKVSDAELVEKFWHDVLYLYFVKGKSLIVHQDDLIFFVRKADIQPYGFDDNARLALAPYFVRRLTSEAQLNDMDGEDLSSVDWRCSFYLNLIEHTSFSVTIAICSHQALRNHQARQDTPLSSIYKVVKTIYASPNRVNFHLESRKEEEPQPAYPDICFTIDDFDSAIDAMILTDNDHCYCVVLNAHDGAAFPVTESCGCTGPHMGDVQHGNVKNPKVTLFSGFVSYETVRAAYDATQSHIGSIFSRSHSPGVAERIHMKGPGGHGDVEVVVSGVSDNSKDVERSSPSKSGYGISGIIHRAASVAYAATKSATPSSTSFSSVLPIRCCLMSISLPWEQIASDLLFKETPPVEL